MGNHTMSDFRAIIRRPLVRQRTGYSNSTIDRLEKTEEFPKRVQLGERAVGWYADEIDAWITSRVRGFGRRLPTRHTPSSARESQSTPLLNNPDGQNGEIDKSGEGSQR